MKRKKVHNQKIASLTILGTFAILILSLLEPLMGWVLVLCACSLSITLYKAFKRSSPVKNSILNLLAVLCISILIWLAQDYGLLKTMINLLVVACCLKILNLHYTGDYQMVASIQLFLVACGLIFHQSLLNSLSFACLVILIFYVLHAIKIKDTELKTYVKHTIILLFQAIPIAGLLFFVTPKLSPLWQMPVSKSNTTGLSESMTPGDIASLAKSDELVFRAEFKGLPPSPQARYWRAIVLDEFDGKTWSIAKANKSFDGPPTVEFSGASLDYIVIAQPSSTKWLYTLDIPILMQGLSTQTISINQQFQLSANTPMYTQGLYAVKSFIEQPLNIYKGYENLSQYLQIPSSGNPATVEFVISNTNASMSTREKIARLSNIFAIGDFRYTLTPPLMQTAPVDEFLFENQAGFCSHYASALTYMLRLANVPARIVTGYQGGEVQSGNVVSVHQYDAHAWVEAWDDEQGWIRIDPTAIVAPNRVISGLLSSIENRMEFRSQSPFSLTNLKEYEVFNQLILLMAKVDHTWDQTILSYNQETQKSLLKKIFGNMKAESFSYALIGSFVIIGLFIALLFIPRKRQKISDEIKWIETLFLIFEKHKIPRKNNETLRQFHQRIDANIPNQVKNALGFIVKEYYEWKYSNVNQKVPFNSLKQRLNKHLLTVKSQLASKQS
ncbi:MAG: transglutaminase-like putative cysteine protease [Glaciecola sp.]|jgi:transglutaminase-like putative cysteine protease